MRRKEYVIKTAESTFDNLITPLQFVNYEMVKKYPNDPKVKPYKNVYTMAEPICNILKIQMPILAVTEKPIVLAEEEGGFEIDDGITIKSPDLPFGYDLAIGISTSSGDADQINSVLAHELRHAWQYRRHPQLAEKGKDPSVDYCDDPTEIDADGFAIWYISTLKQISIEKAASILFSYITYKWPERYYYVRIQKAKQIKAFPSF